MNLESEDINNMKNVDYIKIMERLNEILQIAYDFTYDYDDIIEKLEQLINDIEHSRLESEVKNG